MIVLLHTATYLHVDEAQFTPGENSNAWIVVIVKRVFLWGLYKEKGARSFWGKEL